MALISSVLGKVLRKSPHSTAFEPTIIHLPSTSGGKKVFGEPLDPNAIYIPQIILSVIDYFDKNGYTQSTLFFGIFIYLFSFL